MIALGAVLLLLSGSPTWSFPLDQFPDGVVSDEKIGELPGVLWNKCRGRLSVLSGNDADLSGNEAERFIRVAYPQGKWGSSDSGAQFMIELPPQREYRCSYRVRFSEGFDFAKGGKLPGLAGGQANAGLKRPDGDGWTARYMWRKHGALKLYLYHIDQRGNQGDDISLDVRAMPGQWLKLTQVVTVNRTNQADGRIQVWCNDKLVLDRKNLRLQKNGKAPVDRFYFSTFFGGKGAEWAPQKDVTIDFADLKIEDTVEH